MFVVGYLLKAITEVIDLILMAFMLIVLIRVILSWASPDPFNPIVRFIHNATEPVLSRIRSVLPIAFAGIDFSPILVLVGVMFLRSFLVSTLLELSARLV
jgi:YggT family protein